MHDLDVGTITKRSVQGVTALASRTFLVQFIGQAVTFLLTVYLAPEEYGLFFLVSSVIMFYSYFADIGLAAALIQKKDKLTKDDLRTTFTIQMGLVSSIIIIGFLITPFIKNIYDLNGSGVFLYYSLLAAFFLSSLKTIPSIILERDLHFKKMILPEILEVLAFNVTCLILAISGYGVLSFAYAVIFRGVIGVISIYLIQPWEIGLGFSKAAAKKLMSFGLPFQANSLLALLKDHLLVLYLGTILTKDSLGYVGFAQKWAFMPLRLVMDNVIRITFPSFSRLSDKEDILGKAIEKSIFAITFFIFPITAGISLLMPSLINIVPKYQKWEPAVISIAFFGINAALSSVSTPLVNAMNAIGKIKITLWLMVFWTILTWVLTPIAVHFFGFNGVAIAAGVMSFSVFIVIFIVKKYIKFKIFSVIFFPVLATITMSIFLYLFKPFVTDLISLIFAILISCLIYISTIFLVAKKQIIMDFKLIRAQFQKS